MEEEQSPAAPAAPPAKGKGMWIGIVVVVIVIVLLLVAVFGGLFAPPPEEKVLRIGTVLSKTGGLSAFGTKNEQGAKLAIEQINAAGGVFGKAIQAFHEDDQTQPSVGRDAATKLVTTNQVDGIVGATGSGICLQVLEVAKANQVFQISGSCTSPAFTDTTTNGGWFARTAPSDALQGVVAAEYAYTNESLRNVAVVGINNPYGRGLADVFESKFVALGGNITIKRIVTSTDEGATSYVTDLTAIMATNPEAIYLVAYPPDGRLMMRDWDANPAWSGVRWLFSEGVFDQAGFIDPLINQDGLAPATVQTFEGSAPSAYGGIQGPAYTAWSATYNTRWGQDPFLFDANVYDAMFLMALAAEASGLASGTGIQSKIREVSNPPGTVIGPGEWAKALTELAAGRQINYEGASGAVDIDANGDPFSGYIIWGVNSTNQAFNKEIFTESMVRALLPAPPMPVAALWQPSVEWIASAARD